MRRIKDAIGGTITNAQKDSANQQITSTYIKDISRSSGNYVLKRGDNTTSTIDGGADKITLTSVTIPSTGWSTDSNTSYPNYIDITASSIKATDCVALVIAPDSSKIAKKCYFAATEAFARKLRVRARNVPTANIEAFYYVVQQDVLMAFGSTPIGVGGIASPYVGAGFHNSVYRGDDITYKFNDGTLFSEISSGAFTNLYIGDYFVKTYGGTSIKFRIAGFDMYYGYGDTALTKHHAVIVPDESLIMASMNGTNTTSGGYVGSAFYQQTLPIINTNISNIVGSSHLISYRDILTNATDDSVSGAGAGLTGAASGWDWYDTKCRLMSEVEVYGTRVLSSSYFDVGMANHQLPLFALNPSLIVSPKTWWYLSSIVNSGRFCQVDQNGFASYGRSSLAYGIRPRFLIG